MPGPHPHLVLEREGALASIVSDLHYIREYARRVAYYNRIHGFGLQLPSDDSVTALIDDCIRLHDAGRKS